MQGISLSSSLILGAIAWNLSFPCAIFIIPVVTPIVTLAVTLSTLGMGTLFYALKHRYSPRLNGSEGRELSFYNPNIFNFRNDSMAPNNEPNGIDFKWGWNSFFISINRAQNRRNIAEPRVALPPANN